MCEPRSTRSSRPSALYSVSSTPFTTPYPPATTPATRQCSSRQLLAGGEVDPRDLEERDVVGAGVDARLRRLDEARDDRRSQDRLIRGHRIRKPDGVGTRIRGDQAPGVRLGEARADERVLDDATESLLLREPSLDVPTERHRQRDAVEQRPRHLLDQIGLARHVARAPRRNGDVPVVGDVEAEAAKRRALLVGGHVDPDQARRALGAEANDRALREPGVDVGVARHPRAGEIDEQAAREHGRVLGEIRIDSFLPAIRAGRAQRESLRRAQDPERLEVRRLEQHLGRRRR